MVVGFDIQYLFKFPVETVIKNYFDLSKKNNKENVSDVQITKDDANDMVCYKRITVWENILPKFFQRLPILQRKFIEFYEEIWCQPEQKRHWIRRMNKTWEEDYEIGRLVFISPHENNPNWTLWEEHNVINFGSYPRLGFILEMYLKRKLKLLSYNEIKLLEEINSKYSK